MTRFMTRSQFLASLAAAGITLAALVSTYAWAQQQDAAQPPLPPGWTQEDMQKCIAAGTPGDIHKQMAKGVGMWKGKNTMWMYPGAEPVQYESSVELSMIMDGRFLKVEIESQMPGMGPYHGIGVYGYDNVQGRHVSMWIDTLSTAITHGVGEPSPDGKSLVFTYNFHCPVTGKPTTMREVNTSTGPDSETLELYTIEPKTGKEYKMMQIDLTRQK
jgi:hypothetical protein